MFNTPPSHGILQFKSMPELPIKEDDVAPLKPYVEKSLPKTWYRKKHKPRSVPHF
jgi:hypothetical protein